MCRAFVSIGKRGFKIRMRAARFVSIVNTCRAFNVCVDRKTWAQNSRCRAFVSIVNTSHVFVSIGKRDSRFGNMRCHREYLPFVCVAQLWMVQCRSQVLVGSSDDSLSRRLGSAQLWIVQCRGQVLFGSSDDCLSRRLVQLAGVSHRGILSENRTELLNR